MFYFPSDGEYFPFGCENVLRKFQYVIAMSKFAQAQIKRLFNIDVDYIPHGIDTEFFKPVDEITKRQLRDKWSPRMQTDLQDKFIISSVGRNQGRKALPEFLKVLGKFVKGKEKDVRIILHCDPEDPAGIGPPQWLFSLLQRYGLEHVVRFSGTKVWYQFPFEDYREMYQIADIHALATTGEGFGIPTMESQSCGLPNVITDYTTSKELVGEPKSGIIVPVGYELTGTWTVERGFVDKDKMYEALETLYKDENLRKEMGRNARENALKYDWNKVVFPMWDKKIKEVLEE
jgi:glycosyltransferase involved in cell wall biosynthesis